MVFTKENAAKHGQKGGKNTHKRYGSGYMKMTGRKGGRPKKLSTVSDLQENQAPDIITK